MKLNLFILLSLFPVVLSAQTISESEALQVAQRFMHTQNSKHQGHKKFVKSSNLSLVKTGVAPESMKAAYYVFSSSNDDGGFVIVSGDNRTIHKILGYSQTGSFRTDNLPANVQAWLDSYAEQIDVIAKTNSVINEGTGMEEAVGNVVVAPLISTQWDQEDPFNSKCPMVGAERTLVGCSAVAVGQIMNYYKWPQQGQGRISYESKYSVIEKDFTQSTYDYGNLDTAQFLYDVAVGCETSFGADASSAYETSIGRALIKYFDYDKSMQLHYRNKTTILTGSYGDYETLPGWDDEEWDNMLRRELDAGRPILYGGTFISGNRKTGHELVCDGYDDSGYFHFNWGWGGYCDGWYLTTSLRPEYSTGTNYNSLQTAHIGLKPNQGGQMWYGNYGSCKFVWGHSDYINVMYCYENESTHKKYYGKPNTYELPANKVGVFYSDVPDALPKGMPDGTYRKYLVCNEPGTEAYQTLEYGYAKNRAEIAETFTWVDIVNGIWTESSSRRFNAKVEGAEVSYYVLNDEEVKITDISAFSNAPKLESKATYRGKEYTVTEIQYNLGNLRPVYPETIKRMSTSISADVVAKFPAGLEELSLYYDGTQLTLPSTLRNLSLKGFKGTELTLPTSLENISGFYAPELINLTIPASVCQLPLEYNEEGNFNALQARKLTSLIFEDHCKVKKIPGSSFSGCSRLSKLILSEGLEQIDNQAFADCISLTDVMLPNSVKEIGEKAFSGCSNISSFTVSDDSQLEKIGLSAFNYCNISQFNFPASLKIADDPFSNMPITEADLSRTQIEDVNLGFQKCASLASVILPNTVKSISYLNIEKATSLMVPYGVENITSLDAPSLVSLTLPASLTYFGDSNMAAGANVICEAITPPEGRGLTCMTKSGKYYRDITIYIPDGTKSAYTNFKYIPPRMHSEYYYFSPLVEMVKTEKPFNLIEDENGIKVMGSTNVDGDLKIPAYISTPSGQVEVHSIGEYAFSTNASLRTIDIPATVGKTIEAKTRATSSVSGIGNYAFAYCPNLEMVTVHWDSPLSISDDVFMGVDLSKVILFVPESAISAYESAEVWKDFGNIVGVGDPIVDGITSTLPYNNYESIRYNLSGQRVGNSYHGIVIVNGKKMLSK